MSRFRVFMILKSCFYVLCSTPGIIAYVHQWNLLINRLIYCIEIFFPQNFFFFFIRSPQLEEPLFFFFCCEYLLFFLFFPLLTLIENDQNRTLHTFFKLRYGTSAFPTEILIWVIFSLTKYIKCTVIKKRQKILLHISNVFYLRFSSSGATFTQHFRKPSKTITGVTDLWIIFMNRKHLKLMIVLL